MNNPNFSYGDVPTAAQWNQYFAAKQDVLGYTPVNQAGDTMLGRLVTTAPTASASGFNLTPGVAPNAPVNGDLWVTTEGLFVRVGSTTLGPLIPGFSIWKPAVKYATPEALPANTYDNGNAGIGATLTASANGALTVDGSALSIDDRVLVKNEAAAANNGLYIVTSPGSGSVPYLLTRATDSDQPDELTAGNAIAVTMGATLANTFWIQTSAVDVIGTDSISFSEFLPPYNQILQIGSAAGGDLTGTLPNPNVSTLDGGKTFLEVITEVAAALPTTLPGSSNQLWNNGGIISLS